MCKDIRVAVQKILHATLAICFASNQVNLSGGREPETLKQKGSLPRGQGTTTKLPSLCPINLLFLPMADFIPHDQYILIKVSLQRDLTLDQDIGVLLKGSIPASSGDSNHPYAQNLRTPKNKQSPQKSKNMKWPHFFFPLSSNPPKPKSTPKDPVFLLKYTLWITLFKSRRVELEVNLVVGVERGRSIGSAVRGLIGAGATVVGTLEGVGPPGHRARRESRALCREQEGGGVMALKCRAEKK
nr:hypothetical protein Iba_chr11fCG9640 [Ipomoea batatas]